MSRVAKVTVTLAEQAALDAAIQYCRQGTEAWDDSRYGGLLEGLLAKVLDARLDTAATTTYPVQRFLEILAKSRRVAIPAKAPGGYYAKLSRMIAGHDLTDARVELLVAWLDRQTWMRGASSAETVAMKLADWLARAEKDARGTPATTATGAPPELGD